MRHSECKHAVSKKKRQMLIGISEKCDQAGYRYKGVILKEKKWNSVRIVCFPRIKAGKERHDTAGKN